MTDTTVTTSPAVTATGPRTEYTMKDAATRSAADLKLKRCSFTSQTNRQCLLAEGHPMEDGDGYKGGHKFQIRTGGVKTPPSLAELRRSKGTKVSLKMEPVPSTEDLGKEVHKDIPRDEDQRRVDADAKTAYEGWVKAGKPQYFEDSPVQRYIFPPEAFDTVVLMLRRATQGGASMNGKKLSYRRKTHVSGNTMIYFAIADAALKAKPKTGQA